jgi:cell wall assembly regulator SMI1
MTPKELIQQFSNTLELRPGLSESQIADFQNGMGVALPPEIRDLLRYSVGFDLHTKSKRSSEAPVRFTGNPGFAFEETFPKSVPVLPDGVGNYWVVDINANTGKWDCVFFACHDPPVVAIVAPNLLAFLTQLLKSSADTASWGFYDTCKEYVNKIWKDEPWLMPIQEARSSGDPVLSNFATDIADNFYLCDLRKREVGSGFGWGLAGSNTTIKRAGTELIFAIETR